MYTQNNNLKLYIMKTTGRYSEFEEVETNPSEPFLKDLNSDLEKINKYFKRSESLKIKIEMIEAITNNIKKS